MLTQTIAVLRRRQLIDLQRVAQDGLRVRASAGSGSFRRRKKLQQYLREARAQVAAVKRLAEDPALNASAQAARERAAREREERVKGPLAALKDVASKRAGKYSGGGRHAKGEPRGSTTDPAARKMRMANGGFGPGYNIQLPTDAVHGVIVGVSVTNNGSDTGQAPPMIEQIEQRTGGRPKDYLVGAAYTDKASVDALAAREVTLYGAVPARNGKDPFQPQLNDSAAVSAWRRRMGSAQAQEIYKQRAPTSERCCQRGRQNLSHYGSDARAGRRQGALRRPVERVGAQPHALVCAGTDQMSKQCQRPRTFVRVTYRHAPPGNLEVMARRINKQWCRPTDCHRSQPKPAAPFLHAGFRQAPDRVLF